MRTRSKVIVWMAAAGLAAPAGAVRFYDDDPLEREPRPRHVESARRRKIDDLYDLMRHTLALPGERHTKERRIPARAVNTLGEPMDGAWYQARHWRRPLSIAELVRGPGAGNPPDPRGPWSVIAGKNQGVTPGFRIRDARGVRYVLKFDPVTNPEMATAADVITSRFFHALGYHVPEYYLVSFRRDQLVIDPKAKIPDERGHDRPMKSRDIDEILMKAPLQADGTYRAVASLFLSGQDLGPFRYYGTRADDPNDIVPHEHRRDLRGLFVFCAWLGHDDSRAINTLDMLVEENGLRFIKHYLIDFGSTLGSASTKSNSARSGNTYLFSLKPAIKEFFSLGLYVPKWARYRYPNIPAVGKFQADIFDPQEFSPEYPNPAFANRLPDDNFWAARQVMEFTDEQIAAIVKSGQYSDPRATDLITRVLIERRNRVGRRYFSMVLPLDRFAVREGELRFEDLAVQHRLAAAREYQWEWSEFDNEAERHTPLPGHASARVPRSRAKYLSAKIAAGDPHQTVRVYLRAQGAGAWQVAGIERTW